MDERAAEETSRALEHLFADAGGAAGEAFSKQLGRSLSAMGGNVDRDVQASLDKMVHSADVAGAAVGAALIGGITAAAIGLSKIGEQFENINRGIITSTTATGDALDGLKSHADALVGTLDTAVGQLGTTMGTLSTRLSMGPGEALDTLTRHVTELGDRFGRLDVSAFAGALVEMHVNAAQADTTLASLLQTSRSYAVNLGEVITNVSQFASVFNEVNLNMEQSAHLVADLTARHIPLNQAILGLEVAEKAAAKAGQDLPTYIRDAAASMEHYHKIGNDTAADEIAVAVFGQRRWAQAKEAADSYLQTVRAGPDAWHAQAQSIDQFTEATQTLHNVFQQFRDRMEKALGPIALKWVDDLRGRLEQFGDWATAHQDDIANLFKGAAEIAGTVITVLEKITEVLGAHPALIKAVAVAFLAWESIKGITTLITGLQTVSALLTGLPAESAAAGAGMTAGLAPAIAALSAVATGLALLNLHGSAPGAGAPNMADPNDKRAAGQRYAQSHGGQMPPGYQQWIEKGGAMPPEIAPYYQQPTPKPWWNQSPPAPQPPAPHPPAPQMGTGPGPQGPETIHPPEFYDPPPKGHKGPKGPRLPEAPEIPYPAGYGGAPQPGETEQQYRRRQTLIEDEHKIATDQARLDQLMADHNATAADIQKEKNKLLEDERKYYQDQMAVTKKTSGALEEFGAKIDSDFGISKGLSGIAENLFKFVANLAAAPVYGALQGAKGALGGPTYGASGLIGMGALGGMFGEQYTPEALAASGASPTGRGHGGGGALGGPLGSILGPSRGGAAMGQFGTWPGFSGRNNTGSAGGAQGNYYRETYPGAFTGAAASGGVPLIQNADGTWTSPNPAWAHLINRESSGRNITQGIQDVNSGGNEAFGIFQITPGTWKRYGGQGSVYNSSPQEQAIVAARILRGNPTGSDWGAGIPGRENASALLSGLGPSAGPPGFAAGGSVPGSGAIPIMAHEGEHVLTSSDVQKMGGQAGVYSFRNALHENTQSGDPGGASAPKPPPAPVLNLPKAQFGPGGEGPGKSMIGTIAPRAGSGPGFQVTGSGLVGVAESVPATAASMAIAAAAAALHGGAIEDLVSYDQGGAVPQSTAALGAAAAGGGAGGSPGGAGGGGAPGGSLIGAAINIGMQELNEGISKGGQAVGAIVGGLQQTFGLEQFAKTKTGQTSWLTKLVGGITGAHPQLPNLAGPKGSAPGLTPEQAAAGANPPGGGGAAGAGDVHQTGVNIEHYHVESTEDRAGADLARHGMAMNNSSPQTGSR